MVLTGVLFKETINAAIRFDSGFFGSSCRSKDIADMNRLKFGEGSASNIVTKSRLPYSENGLVAGRLLLSNELKESWKADRQLLTRLGW
jgi:hypothetical protein